jgi:hypothetical protein
MSNFAYDHLAISTDEFVVIFEDIEATDFQVWRCRIVMLGV